MTSRAGRLGTLGWWLAVIALAACFAMIGIGIAGLRGHERVTPKVSPLRFFIPPVTAIPPATFGWDLLTVDPRTRNTRVVATLTGNQRDGEPSPDGRRVLFVEHPRPVVRSQISVLKPDGTVQRLTHL